MATKHRTGPTRAEQQAADHWNRSLPRHQVLRVTDDAQQLAAALVYLARWCHAQTHERNSDCRGAATTHAQRQLLDAGPPAALGCAVLDPRALNALLRELRRTPAGDADQAMRAVLVALEATYDDQDV